MSVFNSIHEIRIDVFGDFTSVIKDAQALALYTNKQVKFIWNTTNFTIKGNESLNDLWDHHHNSLYNKRKQGA